MTTTTTTCRCGCGGTPRRAGRAFVQGHDTKMFHRLPELLGCRDLVDLLDAIERGDVGWRGAQ